MIPDQSYQLFQPEKKVRDLLLGCGEIEGMRLIKKGALFRGYAYVTFKEKVGADNALLRDRNQVEKRPAFITRYVDKVNYSSQTLMKDEFEICSFWSKLQLFLNVQI